MVSDLDTLHLRSHAEGVCRDLYEIVTDDFSITMTQSDYDLAHGTYHYSLDILCLMALTEALGLEYGDFA